MSDYYAYLFSRADGTPCYVGKGRAGRWQRHAQGYGNRHLFNIMRQTAEPLPFRFIREGLTEHCALTLERCMIALYGRETAGGTLVNLTDGGEGMTGHIATPVPRTPEWNAKISASLQGNTRTLGYRHSDEARAQISRAGRDIERTRSPEHNEIMRKTHLGAKRSPEARARMAAAMRASHARKRGLTV